MTLAMHFNGTQHVVIASVCSDDFSRPGSLRAERSNLSLIKQTSHPGKKYMGL
ncbi:MAG: hypothetical protein U0586_10350 [Candidatus Brocadiaceae bacterium]